MHVRPTSVDLSRILQSPRYNKHVPWTKDKQLYVSWWYEVCWILDVCTFSVCVCSVHVCVQCMCVFSACALSVWNLHKWQRSE